MNKRPELIAQGVCVCTPCITANGFYGRLRPFALLHFDIDGRGPGIRWFKLGIAGAKPGSSLGVCINPSESSHQVLGREDA